MLLNTQITHNDKKKDELYLKMEDRDVCLYIDFYMRIAVYYIIMGKIYKLI